MGFDHSVSLVLRREGLSGSEFGGFEVGFGDCLVDGSSRLRGSIKLSFRLSFQINILSS